MKIRSMQYLIEDCMQYPNENMEYAVFDSSLYAVFNMKIRSMQYLIQVCMQYSNENSEYAVFDSSLYAVFK